MVYQLKNTDIGNASKVLGKSFINYPVFKFIFPNEQIRKNKIHHVQAFLIKLGMYNGFVTAPSKNIEGVAVWINSPNSNSPMIDGIKAGVFSLPIKIGVKPFSRLMKIGSVNGKTRADILKGQKCFILESVGVDPQFQKQRFAHKLITSGLNYADKLKTPCYLETSDQINVNIYKKYGFFQIHEFEKISVKTYCLYREQKTLA